MKAPLLTLAVMGVFAASATAQTTSKPIQKQAPGATVAGQTKGTQSATAAPTGAAQRPLFSFAPQFVGGSDSCTTPDAIAGIGPHSFNNSGATTGAEGQSESLCLAFGTMGIDADVWFVWTAGFTGTAELTTCGGTTIDSKVAVYAGSGCPTGSALACNDDDSCCGTLQSRVTFSVTNLQMYTIQLGSFPGAAAGTGTFTINAASVPPATPDDCVAPQLVAGVGPHTFNTLSATTGTQGQNEAACNYFGQIGIDNDVWLRWVAPSTGTATLSMCGQACGMPDTKVAIYNGTACPGAAAIACNDDACGLISEVPFCATSGQSYVIQVGAFPGQASGTGAFVINVTPPGVGNDECQGAIALAPTGPYAFDTTAASTSCAGQSNSNCNFFGTPGIENDRWFTWTATSTGNATVTTCASTGSLSDTKIAVYQGAGCPTGQAIACNDDACALLTSACFGATNGQVYTIQVGAFPGAGGGTGTFDITVAPAPPPCQRDDGSSEDLLGWVAGGELAWMNRFGTVGSTLVNNIQVSWGSAAFPGSGPGNTAPAKVAIWDDPNDDGNPNDLVLIQLVNTTVQSVDTDTFVTIPITPVNINGVFFAGAGLIHASGEFVAPMDTGCPPPGVAWFFGDNTGAAVNYNNPSANLFPPAEFNASGFPAVVMVRAGCAGASPLTAFCFPGQSGILTCPCNNPPSAIGKGCNNHGAGPVDSAELTAIGSASIAADSLTFTATGENNTSTTIFLQGPTTSSTGINFGAGVRCVTGSLKRLYTGQAVAGSITRPLTSDPNVHTRSAALGDPLVAGNIRYYFSYYRDPQASGPCSNAASTFNCSNAGKVTWAP